MENKYNFPNENPEKNEVQDTAIEYSRPIDIKCSPPLTDEELKNAITGEELLESAYKFIDELFDRDENSIY